MLGQVPVDRGDRTTTEHLDLGELTERGMVRWVVLNLGFSKP